MTSWLGWPSAQLEGGAQSVVETVLQRVHEGVWPVRPGEGAVGAHTEARSIAMYNRIKTNILKKLIARIENLSKQHTRKP